MTVWSVNIDQLMGQVKQLHRLYYSTYRIRSWMINRTCAIPTMLSEMTEYDIVNPLLTVKHTVEFLHFNDQCNTVTAPINIQSFEDIGAANRFDLASPHLTTVRVVGIWVGTVDIFPDNTGMYYLKTPVPDDFTPPEWCTGIIEDPLYKITRAILI